jgi:hypothetical protein
VGVVFHEGCEITNWVMVVFDGSCYDADVIGQSLVQACNKYGMVWNCVPRPVDQLKTYSVSRKSSRSSHNYNLMPAGFNALAKCYVPENFRSESY